MPELLKCKSVLGGFPEDSRIADRGQGECGQSAETARVGTGQCCGAGFFSTGSGSRLQHLYKYLGFLPFKKYLNYVHPTFLTRKNSFFLKYGICF